MQLLASASQGPPEELPQLSKLHGFSQSPPQRNRIRLTECWPKTRLVASHRGKQKSKTTTVPHLASFGRVRKYHPATHHPLLLALIRALQGTNGYGGSYREHAAPYGLVLRWNARVISRSRVPGKAAGDVKSTVKEAGRSEKPNILLGAVG